MNSFDEIPDSIISEMEEQFAEQEWQRQLEEKREEIDDIPINLIIDTNWWIYLTQEENIKFLKLITEKLNKGEFRILVPELVIKEWENNLQQTKHSAQNSIKNQAKNANKIGKYLDEPEKSQLDKILKKYKTEEDKRLTIVQETIDTIESIIKSKSVIIPISDKTKNKVIEFGILKKAPFQTKNSTADAIIFFSAMEYLEENTDPEVSDSIFISYNSNDFSKSSLSKQDKDTIHPDLEPFLKRTNTIYERNLAKALKLTVEMQQTIEGYLDYKAESALEDDYIEAQVDMWITHQNEIARGK